MSVWNVLHAARWKYRTPKLLQKSPSAHHGTTLSGCIFATKACIDNRKKNLLNGNIFSIRLFNMVYFGHQRPRSFGEFGRPQQISTRFASWLRYYRRATKLCTMFVRLLGWYIIYTFSAALAPDWILPGAIFTLRPSRAFSYMSALLHGTRAAAVSQTWCCLWSPYGIGRPYIFSSCFFFFFFLLFFPRLISAVGDWMSTILRHMVWS